LEYPKPVKMFEAVSIYGPNILASEFGEWKRQRRIADPSFGDRNNRLVHETTTQLTTELLDHWSADGCKVLSVEDVLPFTSKLTLMITAIAGKSCV
jgi:cytochrome P450